MMVVTAMCAPIYFSQLRDAFIETLTTGYSHYDRQLRNDLLILTTLVANRSPSAPFLETGFIKQLVLFSTFQEGKCELISVTYMVSQYCVSF